MTKESINFLIKKTLTLFSILKTKFLISPFTSKTHRQIIICGIPRSGTSLAFNLVNSLVIDLEAKYPINQKVKNHDENHGGYSKEMSGLEILCEKGNFITKLPDDIFNLLKFEQNNFLKKNILVLVLYRDLRDILVSKHQWSNDQYYLSYEYKNTLGGRKHFQRGLKHYCLQIKDLKTKAHFKNFSITFLKYEEMITNPDILVEILNIHHFPNCGEGYWQNQFRKNIYSDIDLGYEQDSNWFEQFKKQTT